MAAAAAAAAAITGATITWNLRDPLSMSADEARVIAGRGEAIELEARGAIVLLLRDSRRSITLLDDLAKQGNEQARAALRQLKIQVDGSAR